MESSFHSDAMVTTNWRTKFVMKLRNSILWYLITSIYLQISNFIYIQVIWISCLHEKRETTRNTTKRHETVRKIFSCPLISSILPPRSRNTRKPFWRKKFSWKSYTHYSRSSTKTHPMYAYLLVWGDLMHKRAHGVVCRVLGTWLLCELNPLNIQHHRNL